MVAAGQMNGADRDFIRSEALRIRSLTKKQQYEELHKLKYAKGIVITHLVMALIGIPRDLLDAGLPAEDPHDLEGQVSPENLRLLRKLTLENFITEADLEYLLKTFLELKKLSRLEQWQRLQGVHEQQIAGKKQAILQLRRLTPRNNDEEGQIRQTIDKVFAQPSFLNLLLHLLGLPVDFLRRKPYSETVADMTAREKRFAKCKQPRELMMAIALERVR